MLLDHYEPLLYYYTAFTFGEITFITQGQQLHMRSIIELPSYILWVESTHYVITSAKHIRFKRKEKKRNRRLLWFQWQRVNIALKFVKTWYTVGVIYKRSEFKRTNRRGYFTKIALVLSLTIVHEAIGNDFIVDLVLKHNIPDIWHFSSNVCFFLKPKYMEN